jgi:hypothetical protein
VGHLRIQKLFGRFRLDGGALEDMKVVSGQVAEQVEVSKSCLVVSDSDHAYWVACI